jgi:hypothetical protein
MKKLVFEQRFSFDKDHSTDVWIIGAPLPAYKILMHIDFDEKIKDAFQFKPVFTNPMQPKSGFQSLYNVPANSFHCDLLIGNPERSDQEAVGVIQVKCTSLSKLSGKIKIFEIDKENRFEYVSPYQN